MSSWAAQMRRLEAAQRRQEREARKRQKDLERRLKEQAKLSALEQARLEVDAHENELDVLLSIHKEQSAPFDWHSFACAFPPHEPPRLARHELAALLSFATRRLVETSVDGNALAETGRRQDQQEYESAYAEYQKEFAQWERMRSLARRVLAGEAKAYSEAVSQFSSLGELSNLGSSIHMTVHSPKLIECTLKVNGRDVIPGKAKSLSAAGKLVVKDMPKARFHEIYQDYVCGCVLRLAREVLALLPVETVLVTCRVDATNSRTGQPAELPVLSVAINRSDVGRLDFERLDPSDSLENFLHRGDVKASRKSGEFVPIVPLTAAELMPSLPVRMDLTDLVSRARELRNKLAMMLKPVEPEIEEEVTPELDNP